MASVTITLTDGDDATDIEVEFSGKGFDETSAAHMQAMAMVAPALANGQNLQIERGNVH